jgi:hypothetical protein
MKMSRRNLIAIGISMLTLLVFYASLSVSAFKGLSDADATNALHGIEVMPFHSTDILGAKVETADRSQQFFVGIQTGTLPENAVANTFALDNGSAAKEKIPINQHIYRLAFAKLDILIKTFNYQNLAPEEERVDKSPSETLTQHLNYLVENSTGKKSSRGNIIYLNYDEHSNSNMKNEKERTQRSIFGLLVEIDCR